MCATLARMKQLEYALNTQLVSLILSCMVSELNLKVLLNLLNLKVLQFFMFFQDLVCF